MLHMVCLNVRKTQGEVLDDALGLVPHRLTFHVTPHPSPGHGTASGSYTSLFGFMNAKVSGWRTDEPLVLLCHGVGNHWVRHWLRREEDRELVSALVLIDALHGAPAPGARFDEEFSGVVEFARDCLADPGEKLLLALSRTIRAGSAHSVGFGALLRHAIWSSGTRASPCTASWASNIEVLDLSDLGPEDLPAPAVSLLRTKLVPFATDLGPASAPDLPPR